MNKFEIYKIIIDAKELLVNKHQYEQASNLRAVQKHLENEILKELNV